MNWVLALATSALLILSFPGADQAWLAPVALSPLVYAAARERRWKWRFALGYGSGVVYWFTVCKWIQYTIATHGGMSDATAWFVFALFALAKGVQCGVFALLAGWTMRTRLAIPATAALWVLIEYTHGPMGFAWLNLGNAGINMAGPVRIAPFAGVWGISFLFAALAVEIANLALKRPGIPLLGVGLLPLVLLLPPLPHPQADENAVLVQPNIDEAATWGILNTATLLQHMEELSLAPLRDAQPHPDLLVWPEAPAPFYDTDPAFMNLLRSLAQQTHTNFLVGLVAHTPDDAILNSAVMIDPKGQIETRYDKVNLVPFGEFVPWPLGPIAFRITREAGDFRPGTRQVVSSVGSHRAATFICYESVFPRFISRFVADGAEVLVNPSNDGWFGKTPARYQHLEIVRMRAAENGRWILRATNDGVTAAIDPGGRVRQELTLYTEQSALFHYSYEKKLTVYTRWGDWWIWVCALLFAVSCVELRVRRRP